MPETPTIPALPPRHYIAESRSRQFPGRRFIDDGSNFVTWVDAHPTEADAVAFAWEKVRAHEERQRRYAAAQAEGMRTNPEGWRHAGCDHANDVCSG